MDTNVLILKSEPTQPAEAVLYKSCHETKQSPCIKLLVIGPRLLYVPELVKMFARFSSFAVKCTKQTFKESFNAYLVRQLRQETHIVIFQQIVIPVSKSSWSQALAVFTLALAGLAPAAD